MVQQDLFSEINTIRSSLDLISSIINLKWVYRYIRFYSVVSEWLHSGWKEKIRMLQRSFLRLFGIFRPIHQAQRFCFQENLCNSIARSYKALNSMQKKIQEPNVPQMIEPIQEWNTEPVAATCDDVPLLSLPEYQFAQYKEKWISQHAADLAFMQSSCVEDLVSVVLPVYNGADYVEQSIESVLSQSYANFELIIVDDGSTDGTSEIVDAFAAKDPRIRVVHQENQKLPKTLSNGFRIARGEFFTWTSADNIMHQDYLQRLVEELQHHPQTAMVYANIRLIDESGQPYRDFPWYPDPMHPEYVIFPNCILELNTVPNNYIGAAFMYRAVVAHALGNYSKNRYCTEDYDYWMRINECFELRHTSFCAPIYDYRFHSKSLTAQSKQLRINENRERLMLWENFRRDYLPCRTFWRIDASLLAEPWGQELASCVTQAGHALIKDADLWGLLCCCPYHTTIEIIGQRTTWVSKGHPSCRVMVSAQALSCVSKYSDLLIDTYISLAPVTEDSFLPEHLGFFFFETVQSAFAFLDIKAKSNALQRMEDIAENKRQQKRPKLAVVLPYRGDTGHFQHVLSALLAQDCPTDWYEVVVPIAIDIWPEMLHAASEWKQTSASRVRYVPAASMDQCDCANAALWSTNAEYISFVDVNTMCDSDYVRHVLTTFELFPNTAIVCGIASVLDVDPAHQMQKPDAIFTEITDIDDYSATGCIAFQRSKLMLVGGLQGAAHCHGSILDSGWEKQAVCSLLRRGEKIMMTNTIRLFLSDVQPIQQQVSIAKAQNDFALLQRELIPQTISSDQMQERQKEIQKKLGQKMLNVEQQQSLKTELRALQESLSAIQSQLENRQRVDTIRGKYTRHWSTADGVLEDLNALNWLKNRLGNCEVWASVIVPVYNVAPYLDRCVNSLVHQTIKALEIILVDDGSTDESGALCDNWAQKDERIRVIHQKNGGLSAARNSGIDIAVGRYLSFIDSDDWIAYDMIEKLLFAAENCDAQIAECNFDYIYSDHREAEKLLGDAWVIADRRKALNEEANWGRFKCIAWNKVYRKELFSADVRYPLGKYHEDEFLTYLLFYRADSLVSIDDVLYHYDHTRTDSITGAKVSINILDGVEALRQRCAFFKAHKEHELYKKTLLIYTWKVVDCLEKCKQADLDGPRVDEVRMWVREDIPICEKSGIPLERINQMRALA